MRAGMCKRTPLIFGCKSDGFTRDAGDGSVLPTAAACGGCRAVARVEFHACKDIYDVCFGVPETILATDGRSSALGPIHAPHTSLSLPCFLLSLTCGSHRVQRYCRAMESLKTADEGVCVWELGGESSVRRRCERYMGACLKHVEGCTSLRRVCEGKPSLRLRHLALLFLVRYIPMCRLS